MYSSLRRSPVPGIPVVARTPRETLQYHHPSQSLRRYQPPELLRQYYPVALLRDKKP